MQNTNPQLEEIITQMGAAGQRLNEIEACEGAAGNISVLLHGEVESQRIFSAEARLALPQSVPELAGATLVVSGSGCRLRDLQREPTQNLACVSINPDGLTAQIYTHPDRRFTHITSEFNSHLAVHYDQFQRSNTSFHTLVHAQPPYLTYLSHMPRYQNTDYLNRHIFRWQPETIIHLPTGVDYLPFEIPGSADLAQKNLIALRKFSLVVWAKHGVMARADGSVLGAVDKIDYAETGARYEYLNLSTGEMGTGLSPDELLAICQQLGIEQHIF